MLSSSQPQNAHTLTSFLQTYRHNDIPNILANCNSELGEILHSNRTWVQNLFQYKLFQELRNYVGNKFESVYGSNFNENQQYIQMMQQYSPRLPNGTPLQLERDPKAWDLNQICNILTSLIDTELFRNDFDIDTKKNNTQKLKQRLRDIKMFRNRFAHGEEIEACEVYDQISNIKQFFMLFKEGQNNQISLEKAKYVDYMNELRLVILERMVKEEQIKQVIRSCKASEQGFEFRGYNEEYQRLVHLGVQTFDCCNYTKLPNQHLQYNQYLINPDLMHQIQPIQLQTSQHLDSFAHDSTNQLINQLNQIEKPAIQQVQNNQVHQKELSMSINLNVDDFEVQLNGPYDQVQQQQTSSNQQQNWHGQQSQVGITSIPQSSNIGDHSREQFVYHGTRYNDII